MDESDDVSSRLYRLSCALLLTTAEEEFASGAPQSTWMLDEGGESKRDERTKVTPAVVVTAPWGEGGGAASPASSMEDVATAKDETTGPRWGVRWVMWLCT
mmetsp:Transcript_11659/g.16141  ORF Transcript_11659/g.16141 Transcript_11659/m.16141 type:complete len:101 (-) Transcript_11659:935-1237(-)